ncbi:hypothetical protein D3C78_1311510 [compost metagenome]
MFDVIAREQHQRFVRRQAVAQQALGDGPDTVEHLRVTDPTPLTVGLSGGDESLLGTHPGPMHQTVEQSRRIVGQWLQGTHVQRALLFCHLDRCATDGHVTVARRTGLGVGLRSEFGTHVLVLHQGTLPPSRTNGHGGGYSLFLLLFLRFRSGSAAAHAAK